MNAAAELIAKELNLNTPIVSYQGGLIKDKNNILYEKYLTEFQTEKVLSWAKEENIHINLYNDDILYSQNDCYEVQRYCNNLHTKFSIKNFSNIRKNRINKLLAIDYSNPERSFKKKN